MTQFDMTRTSEVVIQQVLARYLPRVSSMRVEPLGNRGGFSGAAIWRVFTEQGDFALRRWPTPGLPRNRILGLHRLLEHLRDAGLNFVSVPLPTNDGTTLLHDWASDWQLEPWMPGSADFHAAPSDVRLRAAMAKLAQWHLAASRFAPIDIASVWFSQVGASSSPTVLERLTMLDSAGDGQIHRVQKRIASIENVALRILTSQILDLFRLGRSNAIRELGLVQDVEVRLQPCLRDVWHDHVLFDSDRVSGLIDPSACRTESVACDLSRLIGSLVRDDGAKWDLALEEYHRWRPLTSGERALITVFDRSSVLLSGWTWLEWICLERRTFPDFAAVEKRLNDVLERMSRLLILRRTDNPIRP